MSFQKWALNFASDTLESIKDNLSLPLRFRNVETMSKAKSNSFNISIQITITMCILTRALALLTDTSRGNHKTGKTPLVFTSFVHDT